MIKYLTTQGVNYYLEQLLKNANTTITLISPYIQLQHRIKNILKEQILKGVEISIICRKSELKENISEYCTNVSDMPRLHGKCYLNEKEAIITSLNLYEFSQQNNEEMGIYIKNENEGRELYKDILSDVNMWCGGVTKKTTINQLTVNKEYSLKEPETRFNFEYKDKLTVNKKYSLKELDTRFNFKYKGTAGIKKAATGEIVLFSYPKYTKYKDTESEDIFYFQGQNTGGEEQKLKYSNKDLYNAYTDKSIKIHLFKDNSYCGEVEIVQKPYLENGKWIFPLSKKNSSKTMKLIIINKNGEHKAIGLYSFLGIFSIVFFALVTLFRKW